MNTNRPEVSVVMSVHNDERYLDDSMGDILGQQDVELELIVIDDGSTDRSPAMLQRWADSDSRVRLISQANSGLTKALIRGCSMARGDFIARHDADDRSVPGRICAQAEWLRRDPSLSFVSCWSEVIGPEDEPLVLHRRPADPDEATHALLHHRVGPPGHGSVMMRRSDYEKVGGYREKFYFAQDGDLWLRLGLVGRLGYVQRLLYRYRVSPASISGSLHGHKLHYAMLIDTLHAARMRGEDDSVLLRDAVLPNRDPASFLGNSSHMTDYFIARCLAGRRDPRARRYLRSSLSRKPGLLRAWALLPWVELAAPFWTEQTSSWA